MLTKIPGNLSYMRKNLEEGEKENINELGKNQTSSPAQNNASVIV